MLLFVLFWCNFQNILDWPTTYQKVKSVANLYVTDIKKESTSKSGTNFTGTNFNFTSEKHPMIKIISLELTNQCSKGCWFCYNKSNVHGKSNWKIPEIVNFVDDCQQNGVESFSFGGGEPLEFVGIFDLLPQISEKLFLSMTSNGLLLDNAKIKALAKTKINKVHISLHFPERKKEVERVVRQVKELEDHGIRSGINFLVTKSNLSYAIESANFVRSSGIDNKRIVYLPMKIYDSPTPDEMAKVAGGIHFQSMSCLLKCQKSPRFCSVSWDKKVAWCSYTTAKKPLLHLNYHGLQTALQNLNLIFCGEQTI